MVGVLRLLLVSGSGNLMWWVLLVEAAERGGVAHRGLDADAEEVADPADVSAGGVDLLEDAVFSQGLGPEARVRPRGTVCRPG